MYRDSSEIITRARYRLADSDADIFDATEMSNHLDAVVVEYSAHRPYMKSTTITSVIDQDKYDLPSDVLWLDRVWVTGADSADIILDIDYSDYQRRVQLRNRYANAGQPVAVMWNNQLYIYPKPTESTTINVEYATYHVKDASGNYPTIRFQDIAQIEHLLVARCLQIMADDMAKRADYSEGQSRVQYSDAASTLAKSAAKLRNEVLDALTESFASIG
jgi:hypothetical protein